MLRVDPCFTVVAVKLDNVASAKGRLDALKGDKLDKFVEGYNLEIDDLKRLFPTRVTVA